LDDVIIFSSTIEQHAQRLEHVLQRFEQANLKLQPRKCVFAKDQVEYLGYVVSREGVHASPDKTRAVKEFPTPRTVKQVRGFLGLSSFYRRLIPHYAEKAKPLTELLRKEAVFVWGDRQEKAFTELKDALCSDTVLAYLDFTSPFLLTTDASRLALGAILSQVQNGIERPLAYASRQLNKAEQNHSATELECLGII
jgi:hypothetical protein